MSRPDPVHDVVEEALDPTAPRLDVAPVDVADVAPPAEAAPRWLPWLGVCGAAGAAVLAVVAVRTGGAAWPWDHTVHQWVLEHRGGIDASVARAVTWGGATSVALPALAVAGALLPPGRRGLRRRLGAGLLLSGSAALCVWLGLAVNPAVGRERPPVVDWWGGMGGPASCPWTTNNCGPNDEPFSFHVGGCHALMGDGAVRFISENLDTQTVRKLLGRADGEVVGEF